jgi:alpha-tubulin suppressor-like RCC1 family protein
MRTSWLCFVGVVSGVLGACGDDDGSGGAGAEAAGGSGAEAGSGGSPAGAGGAGGAGGGPDTTAPTTVFVDAPVDGQSNGLPSAFTLGCSEAACTYACSFDDGPFEDCDTSLSFDRLAPGTHTLAVRATDAAGNVEEPPSVHAWDLAFGWRAVGRSEYAACGISGVGDLYCWGGDYSGELGNGPGGPDFVAIPSLVSDTGDWEELFDGYNTHCGRKVSGELLCWGQAGPLGDSSFGYVETPTPFGAGLVSFVSSFNHGCGLDAGGGLFCLGDGNAGALGDGELDPHFVTSPTQVGSETYVDVAVGDEFTCAIRTDGALFCWGTPPLANAIGTPTQVGADLDWALLSASEEHLCAVKTDGRLYCWGDNSEGQLGMGDLDERVSPTQVGAESDWVGVSCGAESTCAFKTDGATFCWGSNFFGELGSATASVFEPSITPVEAAVLSRDLRAWERTPCALTIDGFLSCWGANSDGGLGRGVSTHEPNLTDLGGSFEKIDVRHGHGGGCALDDGALFCWGRGGHLGQPDSDALPRVVPTQVGASTAWTDIDVSGYAEDGLLGSSACGIRGGELLCWGANSSGQLGNGTVEVSLEPTPVVVAGVSAWVDVTVGGRAACAVTSEGDLYCWGAQPYGELGVGNGLPSIVPLKVAGSGWSTVTMGFYRTAAMRSDGTFWSWGVNSTSTPTQLPGNDWVTGGVTGYAECGVKTNGTLHCSRQAVAGVVQAGSATNFVSVVHTSYADYCALDQAGAVQCFGTDSAGMVPIASPVPGGGWSAFSGEPDARLCALTTSGARHCRGTRQMGSLGDGFDERIPTHVLTPE